MKIHNVFNSRKQLLASFTDEKELARFIKRHSRDHSDTTILTTVANDWNETSDIVDSTTQLMEVIWLS